MFKEGPTYTNSDLHVTGTFLKGLSNAVENFVEKMIACEVLTVAKTAFPAEPCIVVYVAGTFQKGCKKPFHSK